MEYMSQQVSTEIAQLLAKERDPDAEIALDEGFEDVEPLAEGWDETISDLAPPCTLPKNARQTSCSSAVNPQPSKRPGQATMEVNRPSRQCKFIC